MNRLTVPYGAIGKVCIHVVDSDGNTIDLEPFILTFRVKRSMQDADSAAIFIGTDTGGDIVPLNPTIDGACEVTIPQTSTIQMMVGRTYYWSITLTDVSNKSYVPAVGTIFAISTVQ
jgi:hypothetical protein